MHCLQSVILSEQDRRFAPWLTENRPPCIRAGRHKLRQSLARVRIFRNLANLGYGGNQKPYAMN